jgi:hypothetical protein
MPPNANSVMSGEPQTFNESMQINNFEQTQGEIFIGPNQSIAEEVKALRPIAMIENFITDDNEVADIKWMLNDTFLAIVTVRGELLLLDPLLKVFATQRKHKDLEQNLTI